ncbi:MAG: helix-turn-helix transcriptional regulator [Clostridia bacterium]|nr:helix-turn-helix transcriptional regulator [Clostridia bacterium]
MIFNAYADQKDQIAGITLISCGHIFAKTGREIKRPNGRNDWLLFYVAKGSETFYLESTVTADAGSFIIFAPNEKQHHIHKGNKTGEFYFVHFKCDKLPVSLETSQIYSLPFRSHVCDTFEEIIEETLNKQPLYEKLCICKLLQLLTLFERDTARFNMPKRENFTRIAKVIQHMNRYYNSDCNLDDYAKMCTMSKYHFLRVFSNTIGNTPLEYRNNIRLEHAADLLLDKLYTVDEISNMVGYSSVAYFSSAFKQKYGLSPKQYQKQVLSDLNTNA